MTRQKKASNREGTPQESRSKLKLGGRNDSSRTLLNWLDVGRSVSVPLVVLAIAIVLGQGIALRRKFPLVDHPRVVAEAVLVARVGTVGIAYLHGQHGARFVRLHVAPQATVPAEHDVELLEQMRKELRLVPLKVVAEAAWYFVVLLVAVLLPLQRAWRRKRSVRFFALSGAAGVSAAAFLFQLPIFLGYDGSIFTNWVGPGAYSYSSSRVDVTGLSGVTVSYRPFLEALIAPAFWLLSYAVSDTSIPVLVWTPMIAVVYSLPGACGGYVLGVLAASRTSELDNVTAS